MTLIYVAGGLTVAKSRVIIGYCFVIRLYHQCLILYLNIESIFLNQLNTINMNNGEKKLCEWQAGMTGDFYTMLINAAMRADTGNAAKLTAGFPELMEAINSYKNESGYYQKLADEWNKEYPNRKPIK